MTISVTCPKGHQLEARDELAGYSLPCPACGEVVVVPPSTSGTPGQSMDSGTTNCVAPGTPALAKSSKVRRWMSLPFRVVVRVVRGVGLALILLLVLWIVYARTTGQTEEADKLKMIGFAFLNFHDTHRAFALPRFRDVDVLEPNRQTPPTDLSWRVHLLPYLEQKPLYDRFHLDEPWDSPHNRTLLEHMPEVYRLGRDKGTSTRFQVLTGPGMLFGQQQPPRIRDVPDGTRSTIMVVVVGPDCAVPWTKPDELVLNPLDPLACLGKQQDRYIGSITVDGRLLMLPADVAASEFLALATPHGNEVIDGDTYRRQYDETQWASVPNLLRWLISE